MGGLSWAVSLFAFGEGILVFLAIEENTRAAARAFAGGRVASPPSPAAAFTPTPPPPGTYCTRCGAVLGLHGGRCPACGAPV